MFHFDKLNDREILNSKFEARNNASYSITIFFHIICESVATFQNKFNDRKHNIQNSTFKILFPSFNY